MSTNNDNPNQPCEHDAPCPQPLAPQAVADRGGDVPPLPRKAVLLPEIARLSLEGHSSRAIGRKLGVPRRTVDRWLRQQRQQWAESAAESAGELFAITMARLESVYREAMEAWRRSLADKQVTVETVGDDGAAKAKSTLRKTTQSGQVALLGKAIHAASEISKFHAQHLDAVCAAQESERCRARHELVEELRSLPKDEFREIKELLRLAGELAPRHSPEDLADILSELATAEYQELGGILWRDSGRRLPQRRQSKPEEIQSKLVEFVMKEEGMKDEG